MCSRIPHFLGMKQKTRDNLIYVGVALAVVAAFTSYGIYTVRATGTVRDIPGPMLWGILSTPTIIALILERFWEHRRRPLLWLILGVVALINVSIMFVAYSARWNPPVIVWSAATVLCLLVAFFVARKILIRRTR